MTMTLLQGDCRELLPTLPERSVQTVVTSPPYLGLRDYGVTGQLGLEATPDEYVQALVGVFREVWRVLRDDGTVWLNLGDSYSGSWGNYSGQNRGSGTQRTITNGSAAHQKSYDGLEDWRPPTSNKIEGLKPKDLIGIPWAVAFALRADGWYLRSDIIWSKPNPMPESVTDRPTKAHEYIFLLSKSERYFYDAAAIAEPSTPGDGGWQRRAERGILSSHAQGFGGNGETSQFSRTDGTRAIGRGGVAASGTTRNRRTVWTVATQPFTGAHFATFPEKLIEPCILAGSAARACEVCGAPWERVAEPIGERVTHGDNKVADQAQGRHGATSVFNTGKVPIRATTGFRPTCACPNQGAARSVVLDPFVGSGTTCRVAERLGRDSIGIDLGYQALQEQRTNGVQKLMVDLL